MKDDDEEELAQAIANHRRAEEGILERLKRRDTTERRVTPSQLAPTLPQS